MKINSFSNQVISLLVIVFVIFSCKKENDIPDSQFMGQSFSASDFSLVHPTLNSGISIQKTSDGGYAVAGDADLGDMFLLKTDKNLNEAWSKTYGGVSFDFTHGMVTTSDNGYIICGGTRSFGAGSNDAYIIKTNEFGEEEWSKTYGTIFNEIAEAIIQTSDGGYIFVGFTGDIGAPETDVFIVKIDENGEEIWSQTIGTTTHEIGFSITETTSGEFMILYESNVENFSIEKSIHVVKIDNAGNVIWDNVYQESLSQIIVYGNMDRTSDGGVIFTASVLNEENNSILKLFKINADGNLEWSKELEWANMGISVIQTSDREYIVLGDTKKIGNGSLDVYLAKVDASGNLLWENSYGGNDYDNCTGLVEKNDGGYILCGTTKRNRDAPLELIIIETNENGIPK